MGGWVDGWMDSTNMHADSDLDTTAFRLGPARENKTGYRKEVDTETKHCRSPKE